MLLQSSQRVCSNTLEDFAHELFNVVWSSDFCRCNVGLVGMSGLHCRSQTCSQMLHQVAIIFPSSVKTGRSPSSSTPTIVAFVPPGMTSWHDDTICKKVQAPNPIHVLHEAHSALRLGSPTNIGDPPTYREDVVVKFTAPVYHSTITCPKCLAAPNPNNEATKNASSRIEHSQVRVRQVRRCALGHRSRAAWPAR